MRTYSTGDAVFKKSVKVKRQKVAAFNRAEHHRILRHRFTLDYAACLWENSFGNTITVTFWCFCLQDVERFSEVGIMTVLGFHGDTNTAWDSPSLCNFQCRGNPNKRKTNFAAQVVFSVKVSALELRNLKIHAIYWNSALLQIKEQLPRFQQQTHAPYAALIINHLHTHTRFFTYTLAWVLMQLLRLLQMCIFTASLSETTILPNSCQLFDSFLLWYTLEWHCKLNRALQLADFLKSRVFGKFQLF